MWFLLLIIQKFYFLVKAIVFIWMTCQLCKVSKYSKQLLWVFVHSWSKFQTLIIVYWEQECPRLDNGCISFDYQDGYCISRRFWQILLKLNQKYFLNLILIDNQQNNPLCLWELDPVLTGKDTIIEFPIRELTPLGLSSILPALSEYFSWMHYGPLHHPWNKLHSKHSY